MFNLLKRGWGENQAWSEFEASIWQSLAQSATDESLAVVLCNQRDRILQLFRYRTEEGYRIRCVYELGVQLFARHKRTQVATLSSIDDERLSVLVFADEGMISELYIGGCKIGNPAKLPRRQWLVHEYGIRASLPIQPLPEGWLKDMQYQGLVTDIRCPLELKKGDIPVAHLPQEYSYLNSLTDGCRIVSSGDVYDVLGFRDLVVVTSRSGSYTALIDLRENGAICCSEKAEGLFWVTPDEAIPIRKSFRECMYDIAANGVPSDA